MGGTDFCSSKPTSARTFECRPSAATVRLAFFAVAEAFLARQLGGRYEPIGDAFKGSSITVPTGAEDIPGLKDNLPKEQPEKGTK
jgi:hypothetical protein